jgi:hypothetical protein
MLSLNSGRLQPDGPLFSIIANAARELRLALSVEHA